MCELIVCNANNREMNKLLMTLLIYTDGKINKDGFGIYQHSLAKTNVSGSFCSNLGTVVSNNIKDKSLVIGHTRLASLVNRTQGITVENAHPFETNNLVLAHNGTLVMNEDKVKTTEYKDKIDSEVFTLEAEKNYNGDLVDCIRKTMEDFSGKFAFLAHDKNTKEFYAIRGASAKLHISYLTIKVPDKEGVEDTKDQIIGYVINTDDDDLNHCLLLFSNIWQLTHNERISYTKPELLKIDTAFKLGKYAIEEVGKVEEKIKVVAVQTYNATRFSYSRDASEDDEDTWCSWRTGGVVGKDIEEFSSFLNTFITNNKLSIEELDELLTNGFGIPLLSMERADFPAVKSYINRLTARNSKKAKKLWGELCALAPSKSSLYEKLQFPYFVNNKIDLITLKQELMEKK